MKNININNVSTDIIKYILKKNNMMTNYKSVTVN